ncbi:MAG: hypothetical protein V1821_03820 [bacterium]
MKSNRISKTEQRWLYAMVQKRLEERRLNGKSQATRSAIILDAIFWPYALKRFASLEQNLEMRQALEFKREYKMMKDTLLALKRRRLLALMKRADGLELALTSRGQAEYLRNSIRVRNQELGQGRRCYVIFDIPEDARMTRDAFRYFLKQADFVQVQKSVWKTSKDVVKELRLFIATAKVERWVTIIVGEER